MGKYTRTHGTVIIEGKMMDVMYRFIDPSTIDCVACDGREFLTHYASLIPVGLSLPG